MPRQPEFNSNRMLRIPDDLWARVTALLFSEAEQRVPYGRYSEFFVGCARSFLDTAVLDLAPFGFPPGFELRGPKDVVQEVHRHLVTKGFHL